MYQRILCIASVLILSVTAFKATYQKSTLFSLKQKLKASNENSEGYGPIGSLLRQGPVPFFIRIVKPDTYEAAVKKYMLLEKVDKITAQGNMDAYFQDPNGWASNKLRERKTGIKIDYANANIDKNSLVLTAIWSTGILALGYRIFAVQVLGQ